MYGDLKMTDYKEAKSKYAKEKIKNCSWRKRSYINDLLLIERAASGEIYGLWTGYIRGHLEDKYPKEWKAIFLELNSKQYKEMLQRRKKEAEKEKKEAKARKIEENLEVKESKETWKLAGGKPD